MNKSEMNTLFSNVKELTEEERTAMTAEYWNNSYKKAVQYAENGEWESFCKIVTGRYEIMEWCFEEFYDQMPDAMKSKFALRCFIHHGDNYPCVRRAVRSLPKIGLKDLPPELSALQEIIIYRAGEENIEQARNRLSWTTEIKVAEFFLEEYNKRRANHLYKGVIRPKDVIAFLDGDEWRNEKEIIQYRSVYAVEELKTSGHE